MATGDDIGGRGEAIFYVRMTEFLGHKRPLFRPHFLGEKFATLDYLVELIGVEESSPYFFVQVKATGNGYTLRFSQPRLKVRVSAKDVKRMLLYPAPTYVVGIDSTKEVGYILSIHGRMTGPVAALPTEYPLNPPNLRLLWQEVKDYWASRDMVMHSSVFTL